MEESALALYQAMLEEEGGGNATSSHTEKHAEKDAVKDIYKVNLFLSFLLSLFSLFSFFSASYFCDICDLTPNAFSFPFLLRHRLLKPLRISHKIRPRIWSESGR